MPPRDNLDRCDRCGKVLPKDASQIRFFTDLLYRRPLRVDTKCASALRGMAGFTEDTTMTGDR